jgi:hypothetical protein
MVKRKREQINLKTELKLLSQQFELILFDKVKTSYRKKQFIV